MSGFELSSLHPHLGQETLTWRTVQRRGRNCVLKKFPDNVGLHSMSFIFLLLSFLFFMSWHWKFLFFSGAVFPPYLLKLSPSVPGSGHSARVSAEQECTNSLLCTAVRLRECAGVLLSVWRTVLLLFVRKRSSVLAKRYRYPVGMCYFNRGSKICMQSLWITCLNVASWVWKASLSTINVFCAQLWNEVIGAVDVVGWQCGLVQPGSGIHVVFH